jgi:hypothetical protein
VLVVEVSAEVQKTLAALGADIDLRAALLDALNERIAGVQQVIAVQGLPYAGDTDSANAVSFAPFGLELSTDTITQIVDHIFGRPPRPTVRLELRCAPRACDNLEVRNATLVMNFSAPSGSRNASYPVMLGNRGLTRSLHQSVERIADLVLEQTDPLTASVLFLNRAATTVYLDRYIPDLIRAEGAAVAGSKPDNAGCIADLVIGLSLAGRGELAAGVAAEQRAAKTSDIVCKIQAESNIIFRLAGFALCDDDELESRYADLQVTQARQRLEILGKRRDSIDDLTYYRIPAAALVTDVMQILEKAGPLQRPACFFTLAPESLPGSTAVTQLQQLVAAPHSRLLPPKKHTLMQHQALSNFWYAVKAGVPRDDLAGRLSLDRALMDAIRLTELNDPHPRALFILEGDVAMEMSRAELVSSDVTNDSAQSLLANKLESDEVYTQSEPGTKLRLASYHNLHAAIVAFENASGTTGSASLVEPFSDVEVLRKLGDAWYASGYPESALTTYAQAVDKFIEANEPVEQVAPLTDALIRWASLLVEQRCSKDPHPDPLWVEKWNRLGDSPPDVCRLSKPDDATEKPPLLATIQRTIRRSLSACRPPAILPAVLPDADKERVAESRRRLDLLECEDREAAINLRQWPPAETVDAEIRQALAGSHEL